MSQDQTDQIRGLYVMFGIMIQKITDLKQIVEDQGEIIKKLQAENTVLNDNLTQYDKKYQTIENFVDVCADQLPKLLTRLVTHTQSEDLSASIGHCVQGLNTIKHS